MPSIKKLSGLCCIILVALSGSARADDIPGRKYALLIGVSDYQDTAGLRSIPGAENDVVTLRDVLVGGGFKSEDIALLTSRGTTKPTGENIRAALKELTGRCKAEDTLLLAFAGHGIQAKDGSGPCFCPYDTIWNRADTLTPLISVFEEVGRCPAKRKLLLVDACRVDPVAETESTRKNQVIATGFTLNVPRGGNFVALFSCSEGQYAWEDVRLRHGVFFHYTILGLAGEAADKEGVVTLDGLIAYVRQNVIRHVKKEFDADQEPRRLGEDGRFPILQLASSTEVQKLMREALIASGKGDNEAAKKAYTRVVELDKKHAEAYLQRGKLIKAEARAVKDDKEKKSSLYQEAIRDFGRALQHKPDLTAAYVERADIFYRRDNLDAALTDYDAVLDMDKTDAEVLAARAYVHYWQGKSDKAVADAEEALKANPECARAYYVRGVARLALKQDELGIADLDKAVAIEPHNLEYRNYRLDVALARSDAERVAREQARIEQVATYVPRSDYYGQESLLNQQARVGDYYHSRGDTARAEKSYQQANKRAETIGGPLMQQAAQKKETEDLLRQLKARPERLNDAQIDRLEDAILNGEIPRWKLPPWARAELDAMNGTGKGPNTGSAPRQSGLFPPPKEKPAPKLFGPQNEERPRLFPPRERPEPVQRPILGGNRPGLNRPY
jgi:tetratricopeptide (TPR) repeat protein